MWGNDVIRRIRINVSYICTCFRKYVVIKLVLADLM